MQLFQRQITGWLAIAICCCLFGLSRLPQISPEERAQLAARFDFATALLPEPQPPGPRTIRAVHPSLHHISGWISSVGAALAFSDLDGDGLPNDLCQVDVRNDRVVIAPAPWTGERFGPFYLSPEPLPFNSTMAPMGCLPGDLNEDGWTDLIVYYWGRAPVAFLRTPRGTLSSHRFQPSEIVDAPQRWYSNAATMADVDGDGHNDLILANYFADGSRILDPEASGAESMQHSMSSAGNGGRNRLFLWRGITQSDPPGVRFEEAPEAFQESATAWTLAVGAGDLDGDHLPELYFANDFGPDYLLHNRSQPGKPRFQAVSGRKGLTTPKSKVLGHDSFKGMGVDFADVNQDGWPDIYVSNIAAEYALQESHFLFISSGETDRFLQGSAPYHDGSEALGLSRSDWGWDSRLADFDNDGVLEAVQATGFIKGQIDRWPELHELAMGSDELLRFPASWPRMRGSDGLSGNAHNPFFCRAADGRFYDISAQLGLDRPQITRGIAVADVDGDGDLDFAVANQWEASYFYRNDSPSGGRFLGLHLLKPAASKSAPYTSLRAGHPRPGEGWAALGAVARIYRDGELWQSAQVDGGNGHSGVRSPQIHFGLGKYSPQAEVEVDLSWRNSKGEIQQQRLFVQPGWYTVILGEEGLVTPPTP
ncbi:MAG TPA: CRTAC1 family protein [Acidobacteriota bacterium]|nr:CRTAC1 family protein [Acidobacteriota bacterium]